MSNEQRVRHLPWAVSTCRSLVGRGDKISIQGEKKLSDTLFTHCSLLVARWGAPVTGNSLRFGETSPRGHLSNGVNAILRWTTGDNGREETDCDHFNQLRPCAG